jgi:hypothetical protein
MTLTLCGLERRSCHGKSPDFLGPCPGPVAAKLWVITPPWFPHLEAEAVSLIMALWYSVAYTDFTEPLSLGIGSFIMLLMDIDLPTSSSVRTAPVQTQLHSCAPWRPRLLLEWEGARGSVSFGSPVAHNLPGSPSVCLQT